MDALKFTLSGKTAFFKKPDVNTYYYFTYGNIHKIALLGIFGAIMGFEGYNQQAMSNSTYPQFYEILKNIKISIVPRNEKGYIPKKIQVFNNSVGYASKEQGGNLIIKEQWLENPIWDIYLLIQNDMEMELANRIVNRRFKYLPYLGKNDHIANISNVKLIKDIEKQFNPVKIDSLFIKRYFDFKAEENNVFDIFNSDEEGIDIYKYEERLPIFLEEKTNKYQLESFVFTNSLLISKSDSTVYKCEDKTIFFF